MKKCGLLILFLFCIQHAYSQLNSDSLWSIWQDKEAYDTARLESLNKYIWDNFLFDKPDTAFILAQQHYNFAKSKDLVKYMGQALSTQGVSFAIKGDYDEALKYYEESLVLFEKVQYKKGIASISNNLGVIYYDRGELEKAIDYYMRTLQMMEALELNNAVIKAQSNIGIVYMDKGDYTSAMDFFEMSYSNARKDSNNDGMINALNNIAILYDNISEHEKALEYFKQCYSLIDEKTQNRQVLESKILDNIGTAYSYLKDNKLALDYYRKSLAIKMELENPIDIAHTLNNIGSVYLEEDSLDIALDYFQRSLKLFEGSENLSQIGHPYNNIARVNFKKGNYKEALKLAQRSLEVAIKNDILFDINAASRILYNCYKSTNNTPKALEMLELFEKTNDSLLSVQNQKEVIGHSFRYEYDKKVAADSLKTLEEKIRIDAQIAMQNAQLEKEKILRISLFAGVLALLIFGVFMNNRFQLSQKQKRIIESQKDKVEEQSSLLSEKNKKITDSIAYAKRIQSAILPPSNMIKDYLGESFVLYKPKDVVAGDFYWIKKVKDTIFFAAADCTGHGVPGALVSVVCNGALNRSIGEFELSDPGEILNKTREIVINEFEKAEEEVKDGMDIALCSLRGNTLCYSGAHNPLWIIHNHELEIIRANKQPIGMHIRHEDFKTHTVQLEKGDTIYVFTDGFADQFGGPKGKKFKIKALQETLLAIQNKSMIEQKTHLEKVFDDWKGENEQLDDVCIMGLKFNKTENQA